MRFSWLSIALLGVLFVLGCAKRDYYAPPAEAYYDYDSDDYGGYGGHARGGLALAEEAPSRAMYKEARRSRADSAPPPPAPVTSGSSTSSVPTPEPEPDQAAPEQPAAERMVHYDGWARLRVTRVQDLLDQVAALAEELGGKVEHMYSSTITVAVPVASFEDAFVRVLDLGDVMDKSITATDITEAFTSMELRLRTAETTRTRLQALLAKATEENEKLQLLREIARLTEEIDLLQSKVELLSTLASFSRITIEAVPRQAVGQRSAEQEAWGLGWILDLSPFRQDVVAYAKHLPLEVPDGFVALDLKKRFVAESADGAVIRSGKLDNQPHGDTAFWMAALRQRLESEFDTATEETWGAYRVLELVDGSDEPYVYLLAVSAQGKWLHFVEAYYPGQAEQERHGAAVRKVIEGAAGISAVSVQREGRAG